MNHHARNLSLAVLISGGGTTLLNLIRKAAEGLPASIDLVLSSNPSARGLEFAATARIDHQVIAPVADPEAYSQAVFQPCREAEVDLVVMGGFLKHVLIPADFAGRVLNIHPSLIPAFCGKGFYGQRVHKAVLEYGAKVSGCTVHFVDNEYDHGPIVLQRVVDVRDDDTPETLAERVFEAECQAYPDAIRLIAEGRIRLEGRHVLVD